MATQTSKAEELLERQLRLFFVQSAEIYQGRNVAGFIDWLPPGASLRARIIESWIDHFVRRVPDLYPFDGSTILPLAVFKASGHLDSFTDPVIKCPTCGSYYRVDHLLKETGGNYVCPKDNTPLDPSTAFQKSLMFLVTAGMADQHNAALRPETAQNIYINFQNFKALGLRLPFAIAQVGRSYRNEISPRGTRLREFVQAEIEEFVLPEHLNTHPLYPKVRTLKLNFYFDGKTEALTVEEAVAKGLVPNARLGAWIGWEHVWLTRELKIPHERIRYHVIPPEERAFYSRGTIDVEVLLGNDWVEIIGNSYRGEYDLTQHSRFSGANLSDSGRIPHVVEPSFGIDRIAMALLEVHYDVEPKDRSWPVLRVPYTLAPFDVGIASVSDEERFARVVNDIDLLLRSEGLLTFKLYGKIAAQYARADGLGIPLVVTVDHQTFEDGTVTVRDRDTRAQKRVLVEELPSYIRTALGGEADGRW